MPKKLILLPGKYWLGSWGYDRKNVKKIESVGETVHENKILCVTILNDGERWCWNTIIDNKLKWLAKRNAESNFGIFSTNLLEFQDMGGPLDGRWHIFKKPFEVILSSGSCFDKTDFYKISVTDKMNDFKWEVDTSSFHWSILVPKDVTKNKKELQKIGSRLGVEKCIRQCNIMINLTKSGYFNEQLKDEQIKENKIYIKYLKELCL